MHTKLNPVTTAAAFLLLSLAGGCGAEVSEKKDAAAPAVLYGVPGDGESDVPLNKSVSATFDEEIDESTLTASTFTVTSGKPAVPVAGTLVYSGETSTAVFWPTSHFKGDQTYTVTVKTGGKRGSGVGLAEKRKRASGFTVSAKRTSTDEGTPTKNTWTFTTGTKVAPGLPVSLGTAGTFAVLAKSGISTVPASVITGNIGVSPVAASYLTGFSLIADSTNVYSTSPQVTGKVYAANYAVPTPSNMTTAIGDMETAYTDAGARAPDVTELGAGNIGGKTLVPGVYKWGTGVIIPEDLTLNGSSTSVWIFQIAQNLTMSSAKRIVLTGGASAKNIFWQVSGQVTLGTTAHFEGVILSKTAISMGTGATANSRLLAQTAVTLDKSTVAQPAR